MGIDSYGGNPEIVASIAEINRVALELRLAANSLEEFPLGPFLVNPISAIEYQLAVAPVIEKLKRLHNYALIAAENYFTTEAQIARRFEFAFVPELATLALRFAGAAGWKLDHNVSANLVRKSKASEPDSITEMLDRLNKLSAKQKPTIGIDIFERSTGNKLAVVYVPGTQVIGYGSNPLDMASNVQAMAGANSAASEKAVSVAMSQAGISNQDQVLLVGHSQGGMVAGNIAASSGFVVSGLVTFGAPLAHLAKLKMPVMAIEHVNDPVPNISGRANPMKSNWVTIQRVSEKVESNAIAFSHSLKSYRNTTTEIDQSNDKGVSNIRSQILKEFAGTKPTRSLEFEISRSVGKP